MATDSLPTTSKTPYVFINLVPFPHSIIAMVVGADANVTSEWLRGAVGNRFLARRFRRLKGRPVCYMKKLVHGR